MQRRKFLRTAAAGGAAAAAAAGVAAPAIAQSMPELKWRLTSSFPKSLDTLYGAAESFSKKLAGLTDNKFQVRVFAAGEIVPGLQALDAVQNGTVEMCHTASYYFVGKDVTFGFDAGVPFGLTARQQNAWMQQGGGIQLMREFMADYNAVPFPAGNTGVQMGGWFRKELKTLDDLKGLKMRIPGLAGRVYAQLGVDVKLLPAGEIFPALERGVIDAAEFVGPYQDRRLGLHKAAKYLYTTGWHESSTVTELIVNKAAWDSLPPDLQEIVRAACGACQAISQAWCDATNTEALEDLITNQGVKAAPLPVEILAKLRDVTVQTLNDNAAKDPLVKKVHDSYMGFKKGWDKWAAISEGVYHSQIRGQI